MLRWYVIELNGGGLIAIMLDGRPNPQQNHLLLTSYDALPRVTIDSGSYDVIADYEKEAEAMAFIAGLELGHERRKALDAQWQSRFDKMTGQIERMLER